MLADCLVSLLVDVRHLRAYLRGERPIGCQRLLDFVFKCGDQVRLCCRFQDLAQRAFLQRGPHQREAHNFGDEDVAE